VRAALTAFLDSALAAGNATMLSTVPSEDAVREAMDAITAKIAPRVHAASLRQSVANTTIRRAPVCGGVAILASTQNYETVATLHKNLAQSWNRKT